MNRARRAAPAFLATLYHARQSRARFDAWQGRTVARWLADDLPKAGYYRQYGADMREKPTTLSELPIIDKQMVMENFDAFNIGKISADAGWVAYKLGDKIGDISIGASTGTSGNRTLYAITNAEQMQWLGTMLAKIIPTVLWRSERVAIILPQDSTLYDGVGTSTRLDLRFFDLRAGPDAWAAKLHEFAPTRIVAPPRILRFLAEHCDLSPRQVYAGGETLDPVDRSVIEARFCAANRWPKNGRMGQIYMASEGLFAVTCAHGKMHLAEDANMFEFKDVGDGVLSPIITGFRRRFQIMARYRMNDLLRLDPAPCACGSPMRVVREIIGRNDDSFEFVRYGRTVLITADIMRNAVLDGAREIDDFRIHRTGENTVKLILRPAVSVHGARAAKTALGHVFLTHGIAVDIVVIRDELSLELGQKLRRVKSIYKAGN